MDRFVVAADALTKPGLGKAEFTAAGSNAFPDDPAVGGYPVGYGVEWHPTTVE